MFRCLILSVLLPISSLLHAQNRPGSPGMSAGTLSAGAAVLFRQVASSLSISEKNKLYSDLGLKLAGDKKSLMIDENAVDIYVYPTDMNKDGREELFVGLGSVALFGNVGESFMLYMRDKSGALKRQPDIGGGRPVILTSLHGGYPDIVVGGPGFRHPLYQWNGSRYTMTRQIQDGTLNERNSADLESYSRAYTSNTKR